MTEADELRRQLFNERSSRKLLDAIKSYKPIQTKESDLVWGGNYNRELNYYSAQFTSSPDS